ncbi:Bug family tripartite tricarboxylate transporter substrate binding protein [Siccirubricoccus deserti]
MPRRLVLLLILLLAGPAAAQAPWPHRPITILGGFPGGAGTDIYARRLAEPLARALGQPVVVDNRSGAGGNIASDAVAKARPDGYLFLIGTAGTHAINATLYRSLPFDPLRDVTHVTLLGDVPNVLLVNPEKRPQYRNCQKLIAAARARPGQLNYASTGNGASTHLAGAQSPRLPASTSSMCPIAASRARCRRCSPGMSTSSSTRPDPRSPRCSRASSARWG